MVSDISAGATIPFPISDFVFAYDAPHTGTLGSHQDINTGASYAAKTISIGFTAGDDVATRQVLYEQGGGQRGMNMFIEDGRLHLAAWSMGRGSWGYHEVSVGVAAGEAHVASLVFDADAGTLVGWLDGSAFGASDGVGSLAAHRDAIGVGRVAGATMLNGVRVDAESGFAGEIHAIAQYGDALDGSRLRSVEGAIGARMPTGDPSKPPVGARDELPTEHLAFALDPVLVRKLENSDAINLAERYPEKTLALAFTAGVDIGSSQVLFEQGGSTRGLNVSIRDGSLVFAAWDVGSAGWGYHEVAADIASGSENTATLVLDAVSGTLTGYLNGQSVGSSDGVGALLRHRGEIGVGAVNDNTMLGGKAASGDHSFRGEIHLVAEYNAALTPAALDEVDAVMTSRLPSEAPPMIPPALTDTDLVVVAGSALKLVAPAVPEIAEIEIVDPPAGVSVVVDPDGRISVLPLDETYTGEIAFDYRLRAADGSILDSGATRVDVVAPSHASGWGDGAHYRLQEDADGWSVVETGAAHRKIHVSAQGADDADGLTPETAMSVSAGMALWDDLVGRSKEPASHWLLFERGGTYDVERLVLAGASGESALNPLLIGAYGEGERPVFTASQKIANAPSENLVLRDLNFTDRVYVTGRRGDEPVAHQNILFENVVFNDKVDTKTNISGLTFHRSMFLDIHRDEPVSGKKFKAGDAYKNRYSGHFANDVEGLLVDESVYDLIGWEQGYLKNSRLQSPSIYTHNAYFSYDNRDVTITDSVFSRAASFGAQVRSGGVLDGNVFFDNNVALSVKGGARGDFGPGDGPAPGNASLFLDNVVVGAAHRQYVGPSGGQAWGVLTGPGDSVLSDNVVMHRYDPSDPSDAKAKADLGGARAMQVRNGFADAYDDTRIYNWSAPGQNADTVFNSDVSADLDQVTLRNLAKDLTGRNADLDDLLAALRQRDRDDWDAPGAAEFRAYFQEPFGVGETRQGSETVVFASSALAAGTRWDNSLNWSSGDVPGTRFADDVDLNGNVVRATGQYALGDLDLGRDGLLDLRHGLVDVAGAFSATGEARVLLDGAGRFGVNGFDEAGSVGIALEGGRFINSGAVEGEVLLHATGGEAVLALEGDSFVFRGGGGLTIEGVESEIGVAGAAGGEAVVAFEEGAALRFVLEPGGVAPIAEIAAATGGAANVRSVVRPDAEDSTLVLDVRDASMLDGASMTLIDVDRIEGRFARHEIVGLGESAATGARLEYAADDGELTLTLFGPGDGVTGLEVLGV